MTKDQPHQISSLVLLHVRRRIARTSRVPEGEKIDSSRGRRRWEDYAPGVLAKLEDAEPGVQITFLNVGLKMIRERLSIPTALWDCTKNQNGKYLIK